MNIQKIDFYFASPQTDGEGNPLLALPPESHSLTREEILNNAGFSLSTGASLFTEMNAASDHTLRIINGFYFGTGKYGNILAIRYEYEDGTEGWVKTISYKATSSENLDQLIGNWIKGLSYQEILAHPKWKGKPVIGYENDYIEVKIERLLPEIDLTLTPATATLMEGDDLVFTYGGTHQCSGSLTYEWTFDSALITPISTGEGERTLSFNEQGLHKVTLTARNICGQVATKTASITVNIVAEPTCDLTLTPSVASITLGQSVSFNALHSQIGTGVWTYDQTLPVVLSDNKKLTLNPHKVGTFSITYKIGICEERATLNVLPIPVVPPVFPNPVEPAPPALPNTPPESGGQVNLVLDLTDASKPVPPLYKYPNAMKRNARHRGVRESEKVLNDHQEQLYDIRQLHKDLRETEELKGITIDSWFHGDKIVSMSANSTGYAENRENDPEGTGQKTLDAERGLEGPMLQLSGNNLEERIVGIYGIKKRMQELDERIAEGERRYREYENAYE